MLWLMLLAVCCNRVDGVCLLSVSVLGVWWWPTVVAEVAVFPHL